jgi:hypothetical protein
MFRQRTTTHLVTLQVQGPRVIVQRNLRFLLALNKYLLAGVLGMGFPGSSHRPFS